MKIPHCNKHEIFMSLKDVTSPEQGWYCQLCISEKNDTISEKEELIPVKGLDFTSMDQICLIAIVKKYCNGTAEITTEELGNVRGLRYLVENGIFKIKGE